MVPHRRPETIVLGSTEDVERDEKFVRMDIHFGIDDRDGR